MQQFRLMWAYLQSACWSTFLRLDTPLQGPGAQVSLISWSLNNDILSGSISVRDIAYEKAVTVFYAVGGSLEINQGISARWLAQGPNGFETWTFSGVAEGATQFYIKYDVNGTSYYDPGNYVNYQITRVTTSTATSVTAALPADRRESVNPSSPPVITPPNVPAEVAPTPPPGCGNWNGLDRCNGSGYAFSPSAEKRRWQTPTRGGGGGYVETFQDFRDLVGYADIQYSPDRKQAVVVVNAASRTGESLTYSFNGAGQPSNAYQVSSELSGPLAVSLVSQSGKTLVLEPLNFIWQNAALTAAQSTFSGGQKGGIVELFGWPYNDVSKECMFIGKAGYMGVKIWPSTEHVWGSDYYESNHQFRPWYLVYQPVSYRLHSRMGTRDELRAMIQTCRGAGVRVYADVVINHMVSQGTDVQNHRSHGGHGCRYSSGRNATDGSPYYTSGNTFQLNTNSGTRPTLEFPAVPYGPTDFHCESGIDSWTDGQAITKGWLLGLSDLNTEKPYVQDRIATYLVDLLSIGFTGFRVDAAKHIGPGSLAAIFGRMMMKMGGNMPEDWITWLEVIMGTSKAEANLLACSVGRWSWYTNLDKRLKAAGLRDVDIAKVKIWSSDYPNKMPICGSWILPPSRFAIQNDDHDQQSPGPPTRDMGNKGSVLIKEKDIAKHRSFEVLLFNRTDADWNIKLVLSSYSFTHANASGFPDGLSDCSLYTGSQPASECLGVPEDRAHVPGACAYTVAPGKYTRVHRDVEIVNAMRAWVGLNGTTTAELGIPDC